MIPGSTMLGQVAVFVQPSDEMIALHGRLSHVVAHLVGHRDSLVLDDTNNGQLRMT